jgi:hypothetical protein
MCLSGLESPLVVIEMQVEWLRWRPAHTWYYPIAMSYRLQSAALIRMSQSLLFVLL